MSEAPSSAVAAFFAAIAPSDRPGVPQTTVSDDAIATKLWSWQRRTVAWAVGRELMGADATSGVCGGVIAEEMGLGKTLEVMALALSNAPPAGLLLPVEPAVAGGAAGSRSSDDDARVNERFLGQHAHHPHFGGKLWPQPLAHACKCSTCGRRVLPNETVHRRDRRDGSESIMSSLKDVICCPVCMLPRLRVAEADKGSEGGGSNAAGKRPADEAARGGPAVAASPVKRQRTVQFGETSDAVVESSSKRPPSAVAATASASTDAPPAIPPREPARAFGEGTKRRGADGSLWVVAVNRILKPVAEGGAAAASAAGRMQPTKLVTAWELLERAADAGRRQHGGRFVLRIKRPQHEVIARTLAQAAAQAAAPPPPPPPLRECGATLIVTPVSILPQWLHELQKHAPALAARTLVYDGVSVDGADGAAAASAPLLAAIDGAWLVLTTFRVLQAET